jgi:hypothetical protein
MAIESTTNFSNPIIRAKGGCPAMDSIPCLDDARTLLRVDVPSYMQASRTASIWDAFWGYMQNLIPDRNGPNDASHRDLVIMARNELYGTVWAGWKVSATP